MSLFSPINMSHCIPAYWRVVGLLQDISSPKDRFYFKAPGPYHMPQGAYERLRDTFKGLVFDLTPRINGIWPMLEGMHASRGVLLTAGLLHKDVLRWLLPGTTNATPAVITYDEPVVYEEVSEFTKEQWDGLRPPKGEDVVAPSPDTSPPAADAGAKA